MKKFLFTLSLSLLFCQFFSVNSAKAQDNTGTEFWFTLFSETYIDELPGIYVVGYYDAVVTIDYVARNPVNDPAGLPQCTKYTFNLVGGVPQFINIPFDAQALCWRFADDLDTPETISNNGIRVTSTAPIAIYSQYYAAASSEMTSILPITAMGTDYIATAYREITSDINDFNARTTIIAIENNTTVTFTLPQYTWTSNANNGGMKRAPGSTWTVTLNRGQSYTILSNDNGLGLGATPTGASVSVTDNQGLNGLRISSNKNISVMGGTDCTWIGNDEYAGCGACDLTTTHLKPTNFWGTRYITTQTLVRPLQASAAVGLRNPPAPRIEPYPANTNSKSVADYLLITAKDTATTITITGQANFTKNLNAGEWFIYESPGNSNPLSPPPTTSPGAAHHLITANKPIQIIQLMKGWQCDNNQPADPTQMDVMQESTWVDNYIVTNPTQYPSNFFAFIIKEPSGTNVARTSLNLTSNGANVPIPVGNSQSGDGTGGWTAIGTTSYFFQRINITGGAAIQAKSLPLTPGGTKYPFAFYASGSANAMSYGYMGGATCKLKAFISASPSPVCQGQPVTLNLDSLKNSGQVGGLTSYNYTWRVYSAGVQVYTFSATNNNPNHTFTPTTTGPLMATFDLTDVGGCSVRDTAYFSVIPSFTIDPALTSAACDLSGGTYTVTFTLSSGAPSNVNVQTISPAGATGTFTGNVWTSNPIASGQVYNFLVTDTEGCDTVEISGIVNCGCTSYAGTMNRTPKTSCGNNPLSGLSGTNGPILDSNDVEGYILHTGSSALPGTIILNKTDSTFNFNSATMTYGTTYYISRVIGNNNGSGLVDLADGCLSVAPGTPVRWFQPVTGTLTNNGPLCEGAQGVLTFDVVGVGPFNISYTDPSNTYFLNNSGNTTTVNVSPSINTMYNITSIVSTTSGCVATISGAAYASELVINRLPTAAVSSNGPVCAGNPLNLVGTNPNGISGVIYSWTGPNGFTSSQASPVINSPTVGSSGKYVLTISNNACIGKDSITVSVTPSTTAAFDTIVMSNPTDPKEIMFVNNSDPSSTSYLWNFGDGNTSTAANPTHQYFGTTGIVQVTLIAYSANGCNDTIVRTINLSIVIINEEAKLYMPNSFTPDGNEYNQYFGPVFNESVDLVNFNMKIYNRWGQLIFDTNDPNKGWDGSFNGKLVPTGGYTWVLTFKDKNTLESFKYEGHLNLLN
jgi:gliding motility-associated-like protein